MGPPHPGTGNQIGFVFYNCSRGLDQLLQSLPPTSSAHYDPVELKSDAILR